MSNLYALEAISQLILNQIIGGSATAADGLNAVQSSLQPDQSTLDRYANQTIAIADITSAASSYVSTMQKFAANSIDAGIAAAEVSNYSAGLGLVASSGQLVVQIMKNGYQNVQLNAYLSEL